jgi:hypothetical protein
MQIERSSIAAGYWPLEASANAEDAVAVTAWGLPGRQGIYLG